MNNFKRYVLLITYALLLFLLFMLLLAADLVDRPDNPFTAADAIPFVVWAILLAGHHVLCERHMREDCRAFSFQVYCIVMDLILLWPLLKSDYFPPKEWMIVWLIGMRLGALLRCMKKGIGK